MVDPGAPEIGFGKAKYRLVTPTRAPTLNYSPRQLFIYHIKDVM